MPEDIHIDDLWDLWTAGSNHMQHMSGHYAEASQALHKTALNDTHAFNGEFTGEVSAAFSNLRNLFQDQILAQTANNLSEAGNALATIATEFASVDSDNRSALDERIEEVETGIDRDGVPIDDIDRPPSHVPDPHESGDDHPELEPDPIGGPIP